MRLLQLQDDGEFSLAEFLGNQIPAYAILSHTWGSKDEEVTYQDVLQKTGKEKKGYRKLAFCGEQAARDGLRYFWIDTCCIDKASSAELSEAITSMFRWYHNSTECYVYLSDVSVSTRKVYYDNFRLTWESAFRTSRWFSRGWTLQELIAPRLVTFFSKEGERLGDKLSLERLIHDISHIPVPALRNAPLGEFGIEQRMSWIGDRQTTREEDGAYSMLGLLGVSMLPNYGEGKEQAFKRLRREIREASDDFILSLNDDQKRILVDSLRFEQVDARHMTIKNAHAKTCKWLLHSPEYLAWLDSTRLIEHHGFIWIKGKPGTGKSTLMKFALAHVRKTMKDTIVLSFFFNARGDEMERSTVGTYRSLLLQLFERIPALQRVLDSLGLLASNINTKHQWTVESLETLLEQTIPNLKGSPIVCFIDALDECDEQQIRDMLSFFERVGELAMMSGTHFRVCFSSRHYPYITIQKGLDLVLEGQEGHNQDIANYLESELKIGKSKVAQQIRVELQEKASGVFMWVVLVVSILNKEHDRGRPHALWRRLQEIPKDLHELFRDILTRDSRNKEELVLCIQWVLFAKEPLSPEQLYFAVLSGLEPDVVSEYDATEITADDIKRFIIDSSKGLTDITTSKQQKVQFIHESVRDFLLKENGLGKIWPEHDVNFQGQSHERLKQCCLTYLGCGISVAPDTSEAIPKLYSRSIAAKFQEETSRTLPFLEYAVEQVLHHADIAEQSSVSQGRFIRDFPLHQWVKLNNLLEGSVLRRYTQDVSLLYILAQRNMSNLIRVHPSASLYLQVGKEHHGPPLLAALATGSEGAIRMFLEIHMADQHPQSRLHGLYGQYRQKGCEHSNPRPHFRFSQRRNVLSYLAEFGEIEILKILLDVHKIDVNSVDFYGRTALSWAAELGHELIVKQLLEVPNIDADLGDDQGRTPLYRAAERGHEPIVKLLLNSGQIEVNARDRNGLTPLYRAAEQGSEPVVKLLLDTHRVDVDSRSHCGKTPLAAAVQGGYRAVAKLLMETNQVDVNSKDTWQRTPLWYAAGRRGGETVAQLLLDTGKIEVDARDEYGETLLYRAAEVGNEPVVKLLLDTRRVGVDSRSHCGKTPLAAAAQGGYGAVVKLLMETNQVDVNSKDTWQRTPLWYAAGCRGSTAVVQLLLDTGQIEVNTRDEDGRTPLAHAVASGNVAISKLLIKQAKLIST